MTVTRRRPLCSDEVGFYLTGYADGEGSFCASFSNSSRHRFGWEIRPSFSVSQNSDRSEVLQLFKKVWGVGNFRPDRSDKTVKYEVRSFKDPSSGNPSLQKAPSWKEKI